MTTSPSPDDVLKKLHELGLTGRAVLSITETCRLLGVSRAFLYDRLIGPGELIHVRFGEVSGGIETPSIARLLLRRINDPLPVRPRGRRKGEGKSAA
jgi:hypothetical protein